MRVVTALTLGVEDVVHRPVAVLEGGFALVDDGTDTGFDLSATGVSPGARSGGYRGLWPVLQSLAGERRVVDKREKFTVDALRLDLAGDTAVVRDSAGVRECSVRLADGSADQVFFVHHSGGRGEWTDVVEWLGGEG